MSLSHIPLSCETQLAGMLCLSWLLVLMISENTEEQQLLQEQESQPCIVQSLTDIESVFVRIRAGCTPEGPFVVFLYHML